MSGVARDPTPGFEADALEWAREEFAEAGTVAPPGAFLDVVGDAPHFYDVALADGEEDSPEARDALVDDLRATIERDGAAGVAYIAEVWITPSHDGTSPWPPGSAPERREGVVVWVEHYAIDGGATRKWTAEIYRDALGRPTLGPWEFEGGPFSGRLIGLLPPR